MDKAEMIWIASVAHGKDIGSEDLYYSDYLYGKEECFDEVMEYVQEWNDFGEIAFREKYSEYKLY